MAEEEIGAKLRKLDDVILNAEKEKKIIQLQITARIADMMGGQDEFQRLSPETQENLSLVPPKLQKEAGILREMITHAKLWIMDKDSGVLFEASGIVGFRDHGLVVFCER